jgi:hypothetical protein
MPRDVVRQGSEDNLNDCRANDGVGTSKVYAECIGYLCRRNALKYRCGRVRPTQRHHINAKQPRYQHETPRCRNSHAINEFMIKCGLGVPPRRQHRAHCMSKEAGLAPTASTHYDQAAYRVKSYLTILCHTGNRKTYDDNAGRFMLASWLRRQDFMKRLL